VTSTIRHVKVANDMKEKELEIIAEESLSRGENNLAIVLYAYLGAEKAGQGGLYAEHCQDFARRSLREIDRGGMNDGTNSRFKNN